MKLAPIAATPWKSKIDDFKIDKIISTYFELISGSYKFVYIVPDVGEGVQHNKAKFVRIVLELTSQEALVPESTCLNINYRL